MSSELRLTPQRAAILRAIDRADRHLTAPEVYDRVRGELPDIAYATIYNGLAYLRDHGFIQEVRLHEGPALYDRRTDRHDHLVCRSCGRVMDYRLADVEAATERVARETGFSIERFQAIFVGLCPECQASTEADDEPPTIDTHSN